MANNYAAERGIDDASLAADEFLHADVQQGLVNAAVRVFRSRMQPVISHVPRLEEWKSAAADFEMVAEPFPHIISPWATHINVQMCLFNDGDTTARCKFRYVAGDDSVAQSVILPTADGDWSAAGYYTGQAALPLAGVKGNFYEELDIEIRIYCKNGCTILSLCAQEDHA
jgi:hypothetical protein